MKSSFVAGFVAGGLVVGGSMLALLGGDNGHNGTHLPARTEDKSTDLSNVPINDVSRMVQSATEQRNAVISTAASAQTQSVDQEIVAGPVRSRGAPAADCDSSCADEIIQKLAGVERLSVSDWDTISEHRNDLALALTRQPMAIEALRDRLASTMEQSEIDRVLTLATALPGEQAIAFIRDASGLSSTHKAMALRALSGLSLYSDAALQEIESIVVSAQDPQIIAASLNAVESVDNQQFSAQTWESLTNKLSYVEDENLKGALLLSLSKHGQGDTALLTEYIAEGLNAETQGLQMSSIESLRYLLQRGGSPDSNAFTSKLDQNLDSRLRDLAGDSGVSTRVRIEALMLLQEAFEEGKKPQPN